MPQAPLPANALPMPSLGRAAIMRRAWEMVRQTYGTTSLRKIGRKAWSWCLRRAWREAGNARRAAAPLSWPAPTRLQSLQFELMRIEHADTFRLSDNLRAAAIRAELAQLAT